MIVRIDLTLEVNEAGWALDYGVEGKAEIRDDVKTYVASALSQMNENFHAIPSEAPKRPTPGPRGKNRR